MLLSPNIRVEKKRDTPRWRASMFCLCTLVYIFCVNIKKSDIGYHFFFSVATFSSPQILVFWMMGRQEEKPGPTHHSKRRIDETYRRKVGMVNLRSMANKRETFEMWHRIMFMKEKKVKENIIVFETCRNKRIDRDTYLFMRLKINR